MAMTPAEFIPKWRASTLKERSAAQEHFIDLCRLLGVPPPAEADPHGAWFTFEKGARKTGGGAGWADVWRRHCFAWEYKGKHKSLVEALRQLRQYALALENPCLLIVCDFETIEIHTNFTDTVNITHVIRLDDLRDPATLHLLRRAFLEPETLRPGRTTTAVTAEAAELFAGLALRLRERGHAPQRVAHFMTRLLFCLFAEDVGLLPERLFGALLVAVRGRPTAFAERARDLFAAMRSGGWFGVREIPWFNGGLFDDADALPLEQDDLELLGRAAHLDWSAIEPAIFGTLFERGLDPDKRSQLGAHFTDQASILRLVQPVIREPLLAEWATVKAGIIRGLTAKKPKRLQAEQALQGFLERLRNFRVLDPACGSGNFLYVALRTLKDLEHQVMLEAEALGLQRGFPTVGPETVVGIEINGYAAELARLTVWIGEIQWMLAHGYSLNDQPILKPLQQIHCRDALLDPDSAEAEWPVAEAIIGNPPFLGGAKLLRELGDEYVTRLRQTYAGRVPGGADWVCYWFEKARAALAAGTARRAGLVATNSIRGGANRKVLERILDTPSPLTGEGRGGGEHLTIFTAWADEPWINEGAAVRVALVCFGATNHGQPVILDGQPVAAIYADLTGRTQDAGGVDVTQARRLGENAGVMFMGASKKGSLDISGQLARNWLRQPLNPHGRPNSEVLCPLWNAIDVTRRPRDMWAVDFGADMTEAQAALYEQPFEYVARHVKPEREQNRDTTVCENWWRFARPRIEMRDALRGLSRYIVTPAVAKHRIFVWVMAGILPDQALLAVARADDTTFGILHSRFHELWALRTCTWLGKGNDPRYTPTTCFETFPFPEGLAPNRTTLTPTPLPEGEGLKFHAPAIAETARRLNELREHWLNPPEWVEWVPEVVPGYPDRLVPRPEHAADLKKRTLTNLYNQRPAWLVHAHQALDTAVAAAYGWPADLSDEEILRRLLALNRAKTAQPLPVARVSFKVG